jgi:hypothetical protein
MKLKSEDGNAFEFHLLRYEHPDVTEDRWDSNWLVVSGKVTAGDRSWLFVEPCVTTFELEELSQWLDDLASHPSEAVFAEPNLAFSYMPWPSPVIQVRFAAGSAPPWLQPEEREQGTTLDFATSAEHARALAAELREALAEFPTRGGAA